jgi:hypothetical protein
MSVFAQGLSKNTHKCGVLLNIMDTVLSSLHELSADAQRNAQWNQWVTRTASDLHWENPECRVVHNLAALTPPWGACGGAAVAAPKHLPNERMHTSDYPLGW